jgi:glutamate racemase
VTIGVFDSGHGGLTILRALVDQLPDRSFLYYGDHAHVPYGDRPSEEILAFTKSSVELLYKRGCKLVILACNTAAAVALRTLQQEWQQKEYPDHRILGVLVPTVEAITGEPWLSIAPATVTGKPARTIAVFATGRTVMSNAYPEEISKRAPEVLVIQHACTGLVNMIEGNATRAELRAAIKGHVDALMAEFGTRRVDAVMLGCTHYPLVADLFADALPKDLTVVSQPELVAQSLAAYLERRPEIDTRDKIPSVRFLTSGETADVTRLASVFFGRAARFEKVAV